jgi:hypothetical protein
MVQSNSPPPINERCQIKFKFLHHIIAPLLVIARKRCPSLKSTIVDGGYQGGELTADEMQQQAVSHSRLSSRALGYRQGLSRLPKRWMVEMLWGASGDDIASIGKLLNKRWLHRRR